MSIQEIEDEIVGEFSEFDDQMDKYEYIIDQGKLLPTLDDQYRTDDFMVRGCQSKVWLRAYMYDGKMMIQVDSNTAITKGIAALLWRILNGQKPADILASNLDFISRTGLKITPVFPTIEWPERYDPEDTALRYRFFMICLLDCILSIN